MKTAVIKSQVIPIHNEQDIVKVRKLTRDWACQAQLSLIKQTKLVTAASELARNIFCHASSGTAELQLLNDSKRSGLQLIFEDQGPGIADISLAMTDGYTTSHSLGMGLGGAKRLVDQFEITSVLGQGTRICITIWE